MNDTTKDLDDRGHKLDHAARRLDMSKRSLERHIAAGRIRVVHIGRTVRVPESELRRILAGV
jgi:excisionase family DNA binding protein